MSHDKSNSLRACSHNPEPNLISTQHESCCHEHDSCVHEELRTSWKRLKHLLRELRVPSECEDLCVSQSIMERQKFGRQFAAVLSLAFMVELASVHGASNDSELASPGQPNLHTKGLVLVKVYCLVIVFWATFAGGISPYFFRWNNSFLMLGTQFAGGVFLATALIHFLSDSHAGFVALTSNPYPFGEMLAMAGYLLTMFGDVVIQWVSLRPLAAPIPVPSDIEENATLGEAKDEDCATCNPQSKDVCKGEEPEIPEIPEVKATLVHRTSFGDTVLLILALCFHSVFEGIAIGVAETKLKAWKALWTVALHKVFAAIAMGIALLRMLPNRPLVSTASYAFAFAISSPVGVAIGIIIDATTQGKAADWVYAVTMGMASGVFIYVAINHLLAKGYTPPCKLALDRPLYKFLCLATGAATMAVVMIWD